jgi:hypothetical protein
MFQPATSPVSIQVCLNPFAEFPAPLFVIQVVDFLLPAVKEMGGNGSGDAKRDGLGNETPVPMGKVFSFAPAIRQIGTVR